MAQGDLYYAKWRLEDSGLGTVYTPGVHVRQDGPTFSADELATVMREVWGATIGTRPVKSYYPADMALTAILVRRIVPDEPIEQVITTSLPEAGTAAVGDQSAPQGAVLISHRTANIGRSFRGRTYFPAIVEADIANDGAMSIADATAWVASFNNLDTLDNGLSPMTQVVVSRFANKVERPVPIGTTVTDRKVDRRIRTQRRRQIENPLYVS